jgi:hypothetical protein
MTKEEAMFSTNTLRRLPVALALAGALCAFIVPQALAGGTSKDSRSEAVQTRLSPAEQVIRQEEARKSDPRLYVGGVVPALSSGPDVFERYAAQHPFGRGVSQPSDVFERYAASHPYGKAAPTPQRVGVPVYTPKMLAAHYNREDLLYNPRPSLPTNSAPTVSGGFDWSDWAIGIGTGLGLALIVGGGLLMGRHLWHRGIQTA